MNQPSTPVICEESFADFQDMAGDAASMILTAYISSATEAVQGMLDAAAAGDATTVRRHAHSIKSASAQIGALPFSAMAEETEIQTMNETVAQATLEERATMMATAFNAVKDAVVSRVA